MDINYLIKKLQKFFRRKYCDNLKLNKFEFYLNN